MMLEGVRTESGAPEQQGRAQQDRQDSQLQQQQQQQQELLLVVGESQRQVAQWPAASSERGWSSRVNTLESKQVAQEDQQQVAGMTISKAEDQVPVTSSGSPSAQSMSHDDAAVMDQPSGSTAQQCPRLEEVSGMAAPKWWSTVRDALHNLLPTLCAETWQHCLAFFSSRCTTCELLVKVP
jgi:hypothetical protein